MPFVKTTKFVYQKLRLTHRWCTLIQIGVLQALLPCHAASIPRLDAQKSIQETSVSQGRESNNSFLLSQNQPNLPNRDRFLQLVPDEQEIKPSSSPLTPPPPPLPRSITESETSIQIQRIEVTPPETSILSADEIKKITQPLEGKEITLKKLREAVDQITQLYIKDGYITSRAVLLEQTTDDVADGTVKIALVEGSLERIEIDKGEGIRRLNQSYIRSRVRAGMGKPLNANELEEQLRLLLLDPLFENVEASLQAGKPNQSILTIRVTEAKSLQGSLGIDNYSPPSVGSERVGINLSYLNLTGIGDVLSGSYYRTIQGGSSIFDFNYRVLVNAKDGALQLRVSTNRNEVVESPFDKLNIRGSSALYEVSYRQPIIRSINENLALSLGLTYQDGQTFIFNNLPQPFGIGPDKNGVSRTSVISFGQDYVLRDPRGAWSFRSQLNFGTGLFDATTNSNPTPDGVFFSWFAQTQRAQKLGDDHLLIGQLDFQLTPNTLLPSQQFVVGGGQSVRGYRQNARSGDNGLRFSLEDRITIQRNAAGTARLQLAPFVELGKVWNVSGNPNQLPDQSFLLGVGLGVLWEPLPRLNVRLDYGFPVIDLDDRGNNVQDDGFYFSINYRF